MALHDRSEKSRWAVRLLTLSVLVHHNVKVCDYDRLNELALESARDKLHCRLDLCLVARLAESLDEL